MPLFLGSLRTRPPQQYSAVLAYRPEKPGGLVVGRWLVVGTVGGGWRVSGWGEVAGCDLLAVLVMPEVYSGCTPHWALRITAEVGGVQVWQSTAVLAPTAQPAAPPHQPPQLQPTNINRL